MPQIYDYFPDLQNEDVYYFITDRDSVYAAIFTKSSGYVDAAFPFSDQIYSFSFSIIRGKDTGIDLRVKATLQQILLDWFKKHDGILMFIAQDSDLKQVQRKIYFDRWFSTYSQNPQAVPFQLLFSDFKGTNTFLGFLFKTNYRYAQQFKDSIDEIVRSAEELVK